MADAAPVASPWIDTSVEVDLRSGWGATGLKQMGGIVREEFLPELDGQRALQVFREMGSNDHTCWTVLYAIEKLCRQVSWSADGASSQPYDREAAEFLEENIHDMEKPWTNTVSEMLSMLQYGHSLHGIVLKRRMGYLGADADPGRQSKYQDGRIGLLGLPIRAQETIQRWDIDEHGRIRGALQLAPPLYRDVYLNINRCLLLRTVDHKNNPEGRSILRGAYRPWYMKRGHENIEAVGAERDAAGIPMAYVPEHILLATKGIEKKILEGVKRAVRDLRNDEQAALIFPMVRDANGNQMYDFKLLASPGSKQFDVDKIIQRWDHRIAMSVLADFLLLGQGSSGQGSWAMHTDKTQLFAQSIDTFLGIIAEEFNRQVVPMLMRANRSIRCSDYPKLKAGSVAKRDMKELAGILQTLAAAGMPLFPSPPLETYIHHELKTPPPVELESPLTGEDEVQPRAEITPENVTELNDPPELTTLSPSQAADVGPQYRATSALFGARRTG